MFVVVEAFYQRPHSSHFSPNAAFSSPDVIYPVALILRWNASWSRQHMLGGPAKQPFRPKLGLADFIGWERGGGGGSEIIRNEKETEHGVARRGQPRRGRAGERPGEGSFRRCAAGGIQGPTLRSEPKVELRLFRCMYIWVAFVLALGDRCHPPLSTPPRVLISDERLILGPSHHFANTL